MRVLGIDCGGEYTGYGVVEQDDQGCLRHLCSGAIRLSPRDALELRLKTICEGLAQIIAAYSPEQVAIEDVFYAVNAKSALKLGHVRGVAMLAAAQAGLVVVAYSPLSIKSAVVGYGRAEKSQVQLMVTRLLDLPAPPQSPDAADALAIAICHLAYRRDAATAKCWRALIESLLRMRRWFLLLLFVPALSLLAQQPAAVRRAAPDQPSVRFSFDWSQGFPWQTYSITVQSDGKSSFNGTPHADGTNDADPYQQDFTMSAANRQKIFELAQKLNYFQGNFASPMKHIAQTGQKTLQYQSPQAQGSPPTTGRRTLTSRS